jgi:hypothetical protein
VPAVFAHCVSALTTAAFVPGVHQVEQDKFSLLGVLLHVPSIVVKSVLRSTKAGYDGLHLQLAARAGGCPDDAEQAALDMEEEVREG